ncbi:glucuronate isomerase [Jatrophihabitans sp.]|uniref:glucuronate isomerase n=1 Tax=Jatrophihabitans sp. TaxID=1932789 RepID=UPI0030C6B15D
MTALTLHPDRLFPVDPAARDLARSIHAGTRDSPIISPHGHVSARMLADDEPFINPTQLLITPDHYVTRLLHASGVELRQLLGDDVDPRAAWRLFCDHWGRFLGTPVRLWLEHELSSVFGVREQPSAANADDLYDDLCARLRLPEFRPRALLDQFGIAVLATTDDPADDLAAHRTLNEAGYSVLPTMRADAYTDPSLPGWQEALGRLGRSSGVDCGSYAGLLAALQARREYFRAQGATAIDCGHVDAWATPLSESEAQRLHADGLDGVISVAGATAYRRNMLYQFAAMSAEDGLVIQLHPGVLRNHHDPTRRRFGPDTGHDLPLATSFTQPLRQVLNDFGTAAQFRIVLFTVDETAFSREIAPLAGFYPTVFAGAPWWFLDAPAAILRHRAAVTETIGFYKTSGFIDDTRGLCSIPARHDMSRRLDAHYLAELVVSHQLTEDDAHLIAGDLVSLIPRSTFRLP